MDGELINKTMDRSDLTKPKCQAVLRVLFDLMGRMNARGARYSSWYGSLDAWPGIWEHINRGEDYEPWPDNPDELHIPWFLLWEIAWLAAHTPIKAGDRVLDMGGACSLFSSYLAELGCEVHAIDLAEDLCHQANRTASQMGWSLTAHQMDMTRLTFPDEHFDHVFSVCVFEHLPVSGRIECNRHVARVLKPGGDAAFTFDYADPQSFGRLDTPEDVHRQFVEASGLSLRGNDRFVDGGQRYLSPPQCFGFGRLGRAYAKLRTLVAGSVDRRRLLSGRTSYTFGAVFLEKGTSQN